jgi:sirohydrochlorin cobaltochelatase
MNNMNLSYLLVVHGSRDPQYGLALENLVENCQHKFPPGTLLAAAYLELAESDLATQIAAFAQQALAQGCQELRILPLFLAPGVHASQDIPAAISLLESSAFAKRWPSQNTATTLPSGCQLQLLEPIGHSMAEVLAGMRSTLPPQTILLVHGSRSSSPFLPELASAIDCQLAYWAIPTAGSISLADCASALAKSSEVGILLYFLFPGKITTAITEYINELRLRFPQVRWQITPPLAAGDALVTKIVELLQA